VASIVINELTAVEAAARIRSGELTSEALVRACLARIDARESEVQAWEYLDRDYAIGEARAADRSEARGPLHGVPIGVKDTIDTVDMPTALGSPIYAGRRPRWDAACVAAARAAGAIVLGKTVTTEFAYFHPDDTRNPHDVRHTPGGSSSGSAAAVADCMVPLAFGTQTAASVVRPASFCGVYGYKASFDELSLSGIRPFAESLDTLGLIARSVGDIALLRSVLLGSPQRATIAALASPPRIGLCRTPQWSLADPCIQAVVEACAETCRHAGACVTDVDLPPKFGALIDAQKAIMAYEAADNYVYETTRHADKLSAAFCALVESGRRISRECYGGAKRAVADATLDLATIFSAFDVFMTPAAIGEAPLAAIGTGDPVMSRMWTALHVPALAVPVTRGPQGLPVGVQLIAADGADDRLLEVGQWLAAALAAR
jgi:Asp-tRNA(Asn)/Glu-tRNA(Gln) amidotransferase A subunit family amidase